MSEENDGVTAQGGHLTSHHVCVQCLGDRGHASCSVLLFFVGCGIMHRDMC